MSLMYSYRRKTYLLNSLGGAICFETATFYFVDEKMKRDKKCTGRKKDAKKKNLYWFKKGPV